MPVERASLAGTGAELPGGAADGAAAPVVRVRVGALRAQGCIPRAAADVVDGSTATAGRPPQLAPVAPGFARDTGDLTDSCPSADAALGGGPGPAVGATWSVGKPSGDLLAAPAVAAFLQVDGVTDQAVGTQRPPLGVAGSGLADGAAAGAGHSRVAGEAVAADPFAVEHLRQGLDLMAAVAGRIWRRRSGIGRRRSRRAPGRR